MISGQMLTEVLFEEIRFHCGITTYQEAPNLTSEEKFARGAEQFPLPGKDVLASVLEEVFWASLLTEEARPCRPRLLYYPRDKGTNGTVHRLESPLALNRDNLRRITPVQGQLGYLVWDHHAGKPEITGVEGRQGGDPCYLTIAAPSAGALNINWSCARIVFFRAGRIERLSEASLPDIHRACDMVRQLLGNFAPVFLASAIRAVANDAHGGAVWILGEGHTVDGLQIGYPVHPDERPLPQKHEQRSKWLESVGHLAAVDGAVLLDSHLRVLGFGTFVNLPEQPREVTCIFGTSRVQKRPSSRIGGGRHRSAVEFCSRFAPAAAMVVSEDGRISIVGASTENEPFWIPLSRLGILSDTII